MKFAALVSGGKDSIFTITKLIDEGNILVALIYIESESEYSDSYMYQTVGSEVVKFLEKAFEVPLFIYKSKCIPKNISLEYIKTENDEVEDLFEAVEKTLKVIDFEAISSGAILSTYQKNRVENICERLNLKSFAPLWKANQKDLLKEMIDQKIDARIIKIASPIFEKRCIGMNLAEINNYLEKVKNSYEINYCGEGGEYESIVFDCKYFKNKIIYDDFEILSHPEENNKDDGVFYIKYKNLKLIKK